MTTIIPEGEKVRQAIKWISQEKGENECRDLTGLINEAAIRFNLSPKDEEFLCHFYSDMNR